MYSLSPEQINSVAQELDADFLVYVHKTSGEIMTIPNTDHYLDMELESWEEELNKLENNPDEYVEIEKWSNRQAFEFMQDFVESISNNTQLQDDLVNALNKKKPFREFKFIIDNAGEYRQRWFDFRLQQQMNYVQSEIDRLNGYDEEE